MKNLAPLVLPLLVQLLLPNTSTAQAPSLVPTASVATVWGLEEAY
jgi:hypothetical protein